MGRLTVGSCDFSADDYTYVKEGDETLSSFDISHAQQAIFPLVKQAQGLSKLTYHLAYYFIGQYSKFLSPGAKVVSTSSFEKDVEVVGFKNPDGSLVCVLLNQTRLTKSCFVRNEGHLLPLTLDPTRLPR